MIIIFPSRHDGNSISIHFILFMPDLGFIHAYYVIRNASTLSSLLLITTKQLMRIPYLHTWREEKEKKTTAHHPPIHPHLPLLTSNFTFPCIMSYHVCIKSHHHHHHSPSQSSRIQGSGEISFSPSSTVGLARVGR